MNQPRPPYVRFKRVPVEDRTKLLATGHYGFKDVDMACITVPGQKDITERYAEDWLRDLDKKAGDGSIPAEWARQYRGAYEAWKTGEAAPIDGTPIRGWGVLSPAQQETVIAAGIVAVEDLAAATDEALQHIGMGAVTFKQQAVSWLSTADKGQVATKIATLERDKTDLQLQIKELQEQMQKLQSKAA